MPAPPVSPALLAPDLWLSLNELTRGVTDGKGAAQFTATSSQRLFIASAAKYQFGITADWTLRFEITFAAASIAADIRFLEKGGGGSDLMVYLSNNHVTAVLGNTLTLQAATLGMIADMPYVVLLQFDSVAKTLTLTVANGLLSVTASLSTAAIAPYTPNTANLTLGAPAANASYLTGFMANVAKWTRVTTPAENAAMLAVDGFSYSDVANVMGLSTGLSWWFPLSTRDGGAFLAGRLSADVLTNITGVAEANGTQVIAATADGDLVKEVLAESSALALNGYALRQAQRPLLRLDAGARWLEYGGATAYLDLGTSTALAFTGDATEAIVVETTTLVSGAAFFGRWATTEGWTLLASSGDLQLKERALTPLTWMGGVAAVNDGLPHLLMIVRRGTEYTLWFDGDAVAMGTAGTLNASPLIGANIAARGNGLGLFSGRLGQSIFWSRALTSGERRSYQDYVAAIYGIVFPPPPPGFAARLGGDLTIREGGSFRAQLKTEASWTVEALTDAPVTIAPGAFLALHPPDGTQVVFIDPGPATGLSLRGAAGDTGIAVSPARWVGLPLLFPLGAAALGIKNDGPAAATIRVVYL